MRHRQKYNFFYSIFFYFVLLFVLDWTIPFILVIYIYFLYSWKKMIWRNMSRVWAHYYNLFMVKVNKNPKNIRLLSFLPFSLWQNTSMEPLCCPVFVGSLIPPQTWLAPQKNTWRWEQTCIFCRRSCEPTNQNRLSWGSPDVMVDGEHNRLYFASARTACKYSYTSSF